MKIGCPYQLHQEGGVEVLDLPDTGKVGLVGHLVNASRAAGIGAGLRRGSPEGRLFPVGRPGEDVQRSAAKESVEPAVESLTTITEGTTGESID